MDTNRQEDGEIPSDIFRPAKRRKFYRKRNDAEDNEASDAPLPPPVASPELQTVDELISQNNGMCGVQDRMEDEDEPLSVAEILRQRKAVQRRRGGIEFSNLNASTSTPEPSDALVERENDVPPDIDSVVSRFAPQTGQVSETVNDKHMYVLLVHLSPQCMMQRLT